MLSFWRAKLSGVRTRSLMVGALLLAFVLVFYFWRLPSLTPGLGAAEYQSRQDAGNLSQIYKNGINAPYYFIQQLSVKLFDNQLLALRLTSVVMALVIFACLFGLLRQWFGKSTAWMAWLLFIATPWVMLTARTAGPDIMFLWPSVILASFYWLVGGGNHTFIKWIAFCIAVAIGIYTPGVIWLLILAAFIARKTLFKMLRSLRRLYLIIGLVLALLMLEPLIQSFITDPSRAKILFLIPDDWPRLLEIVKSFLWSLAALFWRLRSHVDITIGKLPILNIVQIALAVFGVYALGAKARRMTFFLAGLLLFAAVAAAINEDIHLLTIGLPAAVIFMAAGIRYLYLEWRRIFPLNPFSKALALGLICLIVGMQAIYGLRYALIAWPHTTETKNSYVLK